MKNGIMSKKRDLYCHSNCGREPAYVTGHRLSRKRSRHCATALASRVGMVKQAKHRAGGSSRNAFGTYVYSSSSRRSHGSARKRCTCAYWLSAL